jgi:hypothetical protein
MVLPHEMAAWTPSRGQTDREAGMSEIRNRLEYFQRKVKARRGPKATMETRGALIVAERGLTEKQLAKYYVQRRKDWKPRFDHWRFAKDQGISTDWLFDGDLRLHPRGAAPPRPQQPVMTPDEFIRALKQLNERDRAAVAEYVLILAKKGGGPSPAA